MKQLFIMILLCGMALASYGQSSNTQFYPTIQTPTVASFMKNIDHPVGLYHGNPEIAHILYTLKDGSIEIPLTLQYNASGIKVNEEAGWVGLGWNLNAAGMVVQSAVGALDQPLDYTSCCQDYYPSGTFDYYTPIFYRLDDKYKYSNFFTNAMEGRLQPDVFYFFYPGGSGKFFIDYRDNSIHQFDDSKPIKIEQVANGWCITTESGVCHTFNIRKPIYSDGRSHLGGYTFYLASSVFPNGQQVNYNYTFNELYTYYYRESRTSILQQARPTTLSNGTLDSSGTVECCSDEGTLTSIVTTNYIIEFTGSMRDDLYNGRKLDEIKIEPRNSSAWANPSKKFKFIYDYFVGDATSNYWFCSGTVPFNQDRARKRLKLLTVYERDASGNENNKLVFDYYTPNLPQKNSYAVDYWGYYNGQTANASLIPAFKYLLTDRTFLSWVNNTGTAMRAYNFNTCLAGMLKRITYPTKGYLEYTYGPHEFKSSCFIPTIDELNGGSDEGMVTKIAESRNTPTDNNVVSLNTAQEGQITINFRIERGLNTWGEMAGCRYLLERLPVGSQTYTTVKDETFISFGNADIYYKMTYSTTSAGGTYRLTISLPAAIGNQNGYNTKHGRFEARMTAPTPSASSRGYSFGGGLRVGKVTYHDGVSDASDYTLTYSYPNPANNAISFVPLVFHRQYDGLKYLQLMYDSNGILYSMNEGMGGSELEVSGSNLSSAPYSSIGATVGYGVVSETRSGVGNTVYSFSNRNEVNSDMSYQIPRPDNGKLLEMRQHDISGALVKSEINTYTSSQTHFYRGVSIQEKFNRTPYFYLNLAERYDLTDFGNYDGRYVTLLYALDCYRSLLSRKIESLDGVSTTHTYEYDSYGQLTQENVTGSDGKIRATLYTYPYNYACGAYSTMAGKHMYAYPVEVKKVSGSNLVNSSLTQYQSFGNLLLPRSVSMGVLPALAANTNTFSCFGASASVYPREDVTYLRYDDYGNPVQFRVKGMETVYIWGYGYQYPIAEIKMSKYDAVQTVLGCTPESLSSALVPDESKLSALRSALPDALITTYTYQPLRGMVGMTAPNGETTTYEYDTFGRLVRVKDHNGKIVEQYDYYYKP